MLLYCPPHLVDTFVVQHAACHLYDAMVHALSQSILLSHVRHRLLMLDVAAAEIVLEHSTRVLTASVRTQRLAIFSAALSIAAMKTLSFDSTSDFAFIK